jgi:GT2 family glycosyltransferase
VDGSEREGAVGTVCVEVAVGSDPRLLNALASLAAQTRHPDRVFIAASPTTPEPLLREALRRFPQMVVEVERFPGGVVDARAASLQRVVEDVTAFLDSDEVAPPGWLELLTAPLEAGSVTFAGGPTRPLRPPTTSIERYYAELDDSIYRYQVPASVAYLPLQNTAWRTADLRRLGFDPRIPFAEDHDLETRALRQGMQGLYVPDAWVFHDKTDETSFLRWARKRYRYNVAMAMSLIKNGELGGRLKERRTPVRHPLRYVEACLKPVALLHARLRWRGRERAPSQDRAEPGTVPPRGSA